MAHIELSQPLPGIVGLLVTQPQTGEVLTDLAELILRQRQSPTFTSAEREMVAAYVSYLNNCVFCSESHAGAANAHAGVDGFAQSVWQDMEKNAPSAKMRALLAIAKKVQSLNFKQVTKADVEAALELGATESDVHDAILISAAFCMYNRYVDGLGTLCPPRGHVMYQEMGKDLAFKGYKRER